MRIVLTNGVELPDLPQEAFDGRPYGTVFQVSYSGQSMYGALTASQPSLYLPMALSGTPYDMILVPGGSMMMCTYNPETGSWDSDGTDDSEFALPLMTNEYMSYSLVWANHDILTVTGGTADGFITGDVFFPNCTGPKKFVLPDGTELPPLPEEVFDVCPCGAVFELDGVYYLTATAAGLYQMPGGKWACLQDGYRLWSADPDAEMWAQLDAQAAQRFDSAVVGQEAALAWTNTEVTDWSSGWFVLPDGTELPPFPAGTFEAHPYRLVLAAETGYVMCSADLPLQYADSGISTAERVCVVLYCGAQSLTDWTEMEPAALPVTVVWSNYDLMSAEGAVYHKANVRYEIGEGILISLADEARRLAERTDGLKPDAMEQVFRAAETPLIDAETEVY